MTNDGKIYITISDKRGGGQPSPDGKPGSDKEKDKKNLLDDYAKHELMHLVKNTANKMISFGISQIGFLEGNNLKQKSIESAKSMINSLASIGMAAFAGFKATGSPIGAAIGVGIAVVGQTFDTLQSIHYNTINNNRQNYEIDMLRMRAGLDNLTNDSRTGV